MHNKILTAARKLKIFTLDDIVMMTDIEESVAKSALDNLIEMAKSKLKAIILNILNIQKSLKMSK